MKKKKIAFVLRSEGLEYDDRIRKECIALKDDFEIKIFAHFYNNNEESGITSYGVPYQSYSLKTRKYLAPSKFLFVKAVELYFKIKRDLKNYDVIWSHEEYTFLFPLLVKSNIIVWDLHEIPSRFNSSILRKLYFRIEARCKLLVHANPQRISYLASVGLISDTKKHYYIRNYPDSNFVNSVDIPPFYSDFKKWLGGDNYVYLQGLNVEDRFPYNSIAAILSQTDYKILVVGTFDEKALKLLKTDFESIIDEKVYFSGMVDQLSIPALLKDAIFSVVLYDSSDPNNKYCEANRFYQAITLGVPVITGSNDSMEQIVYNDKVGISMKSDGSNLNDLKNAINSLVNNYDIIKENCIKSKDNYIWNNEHVIEIANKLF